MHAWRRAIILLALPLLVATAGCGKSRSDVAATVDGKDITSQQVEKRLEELKGLYRAQGANLESQGHQQIIEDLKKQALDQLIQEQIMEKAFRQEGIELPKEQAQAQLEKMKSAMPAGEFDKLLEQQKITAGQLEDRLHYQMELDALVKKVTGGVQVEDREVEAYFKEHVGELTRYQVRLILVPLPSGGDAGAANSARAEAGKLLKSLKEGADFATLAKEKSADQETRERGGLSNFFTSRDMTGEPELLQAVQELKKGQLAPEPVRGARGYYLLRLEEKQDSLEQLKDSTREMLLVEKRNKVFGDFYEGMLKKVRVEIKEAQGGGKAQQ